MLKIQSPCHQQSIYTATPRNIYLLYLLERTPRLQFFQVWKNAASIRRRLLFEGGYHSWMRLRAWTKHSVFDSIVRGDHVYKTVWTLFSGEILTATYNTSFRHSQTFAPCLRTCSCHHCTLRYYECH